MHLVQFYFSQNFLSSSHCFAQIIFLQKAQSTLHCCSAEFLHNFKSAHRLGSDGRWFSLPLSSTLSLIDKCNTLLSLLAVYCCQNRNILAVCRVQMQWELLEKSPTLEPLTASSQLRRFLCTILSAQAACTTLPAPQTKVNPHRSSVAAEPPLISFSSM